MLYLREKKLSIANTNPKAKKKRKKIRLTMQILKFSAGNNHRHIRIVIERPTKQQNGKNVSSVYDKEVISLIQKDHF